MSLQATTTVDASADVSLRVPRGGSEDLEAGVATVLADADGVEAAVVDRVTSVRPTWTDIRVDADVTLRLSVSERQDAAVAADDLLCDAFGVTSVNELVVDEV
jgi:hypothetical protein